MLLELADLHVRGWICLFWKERLNRMPHVSPLCPVSTWKSLGNRFFSDGFFSDISRVEFSQCKGLWPEWCLLMHFQHPNKSCMWMFNSPIPYKMPGVPHWVVFPQMLVLPLLVPHSLHLLSILVSFNHNKYELNSHGLGVFFPTSFQGLQQHWCVLPWCSRCGSRLCW